MPPRLRTRCCSSASRALACIASSRGSMSAMNYRCGWLGGSACGRRPAWSAMSSLKASGAPNSTSRCSPTSGTRARADLHNPPPDYRRPVLVSTLDILQGSQFGWWDVAAQPMTWLRLDQRRLRRLADPALQAAWAPRVENTPRWRVSRAWNLSGQEDAFPPRPVQARHRGKEHLGIRVVWPRE